eukprot:4281679-Alexandrium_andersonii.AAC.2
MGVSRPPTHCPPLCSATLSPKCTLPTRTPSVLRPESLASFGPITPPSAPAKTRTLAIRIRDGPIFRRLARSGCWGQGPKAERRNAKGRGLSQGDMRLTKVHGGARASSRAESNGQGRGLSSHGRRTIPRSPERNLATPSAFSLGPMAFGRHSEQT